MSLVQAFVNTNSLSWFSIGYKRQHVVLCQGWSQIADMQVHMGILVIFLLD